jgi:hypothetical protein
MVLGSDWLQSHISAQSFHAQKVKCLLKSHIYSTPVLCMCYQPAFNNHIQCLPCCLPFSLSFLASPPCPSQTFRFLLLLASFKATILAKCKPILSVPSLACVVEIHIHLRSILSPFQLISFVRGRRLDHPSAETETMPHASHD